MGAGVSDDRTAAHVEKETLSVDVNLPEHAARTASSLFVKTRAEVLATGANCWICGLGEADTGHPLELHHSPIERCFAEADLIDWDLFQEQAKDGYYGPGPQSFDWSKFDPESWEVFVDDMHHNGIVLCKSHHIGADEGIHMVPHPIWLAQRFVKEAVQFNHLEVIHRGHLKAAGISKD